LQPITWNAKTGNIVGGHQRLKCYQALQKEEVEVWAVWLDEAQEKAANIALNKLSGEFDLPALKDILEEIDTGEIDLDITGFGADELADLMEQTKPEVEEDEVPEVPVEAITKPGDLWLLGEHRLLCGDSTSKADVSRLMNGEKADCLISDPPYGIGYEYKNHDDSNNKTNALLVEKAFSFAPEFMVWTPGLPNLARDITRFGKTKVLVWFKKFAAAGNGLGGASVWEPILVVGKPLVSLLKTDVIEYMTDRIEVDGKSLRELHSCPKPVALYAKLIESFTERNQGIYEPFCGSGTTLIAAEQLGRKCYGMEISPNYCDVIVKRWENLTGKKAVLAK
jgi:DNA methylase